MEIWPLTMQRQARLLLALATPSPTWAHLPESAPHRYSAGAKSPGGFGVVGAPEDHVDNSSARGRSDPT